VILRQSGEGKSDEAKKRRLGAKEKGNLPGARVISVGRMTLVWTEKDNLSEGRVNSPHWKMRLLGRGVREWRGKESLNLLRNKEKGGRVIKKVIKFQK